MEHCKLEGWYSDNTGMLWASCIINSAVLTWVCALPITHLGRPQYREGPATECTLCIQRRNGAQSSLQHKVLQHSNFMSCSFPSLHPLHAIAGPL